MSGKDNSLYSDPELYDAEFGAYRGDVRFYRHCASLHAGLVVEPGCGTGRLAFELAPRAYVGVDASQDMLERFSRRAARLGMPAWRIRGDLRALGLTSSSAGLVILAYNVLQHMMDERALGDALREAARLLADGGAVALDTFMPPLPGMVRSDEDFGWTEQRRHPSGQILDVAEQTVFDAESAVQRTRLRFDDENSAGPSVVHTVTRRLWSDAALRSAIADAGLVIAELWGDVDGSTWSERSPRFMARCIRRPA